MAKEYRGLAITDYFIEKALSENKSITNMSIPKMIYFIQWFGLQILKLHINRCKKPRNSENTEYRDAMIESVEAYNRRIDTPVSIIPIG